MKILLTGILLLFIFTLANANKTESEKILGTFFTDRNRSKVKIYKENGKFYGKIVWLLDSLRTDYMNPDVKEHKKALIGKVILKDIQYKGDGLWDGGTIYDPANGKTYKCKITSQPDGNVNLRGYIGISLIGRTTLWNRTSL